MRPAPDPQPAALDRAAVRAEMDQARADFRRLIGDATPADLRRPSDGTRWTNQQLLFHMLFGYLIVRALLVLVRVFGLLPDGASKAFARLLDSAHRPFDLINYLGSCAGARIIPPRRMTRMLDHVIAALQQHLERETEIRAAPRHALPHYLGPVLRQLHDPRRHLPLPHPALPLPPAPAHTQPGTRSRHHRTRGSSCGNGHEGSRQAGSRSGAGLTPHQAKRFYDRLGRRQDLQAFYEDRPPSSSPPRLSPPPEIIARPCGRALGHARTLRCEAS